MRFRLNQKFFHILSEKERKERNKKKTKSHKNEEEEKSQCRNNKTIEFKFLGKMLMKCTQMNPAAG